MVNKDDEIFKALFSSPNPEEPAGALEEMFNLVEESRNEWCNGSDVYSQSGEMLEKSMSFFSVLKRPYGENDESYKKLNEILFYRNGDGLWGDKWDILNIFKVYFNIQDIFIVNDTNHISENLFLDGDFEEKNAWMLEGCVYDESARFSEGTGILFDAPGSCWQSVNVDIDSAYFVHFFLDGHIRVQIRDNNERYWDAGRGEFGEWTDSKKATDFSTNQWDAGRLYFLTDERVKNVSISFVGINDDIAMLDYVRLFKKGNYSSFTLIASFTGLYTVDSLSMAPGKSDTENDGININYDIMSYIGHSNLFGNDMIKPESVYTQILEIVKPGGISCYIELLTRKPEESGGENHV
jgi:hypothetical protein